MSGEKSPERQKPKRGASVGNRVILVRRNGPSWCSNPQGPNLTTRETVGDGNYGNVGIGVGGSRGATRNRVKRAGCVVRRGRLQLGGNL
jgi:hypothetical protein